MAVLSEVDTRLGVDGGGKQNNMHSQRYSFAICTHKNSQILTNEQLKCNYTTIDHLVKMSSLNSFEVLSCFIFIPAL